MKRTGWISRASLCRLTLIVVRRLKVMKKGAGVWSSPILYWTILIEQCNCVWPYFAKRPLLPSLISLFFKKSSILFTILKITKFHIKQLLPTLKKQIQTNKKKQTNSYLQNYFYLFRWIKWMNKMYIFDWVKFHFWVNKFAFQFLFVGLIQRLVGNRTRRSGQLHCDD